MKRVVTLTIFAFFLSACGGGDDVNVSSTLSEPNRLAAMPRGVIEYQRYDIVVKPDATSSDICSEAKGLMVIQNNVVTGELVLDVKKSYRISGNYIPETDGIKWNFSKFQQNYSQYTGTIDLDKGSGNWVDDSGCSGTWSAIKK